MILKINGSAAWLSRKEGSDPMNEQKDKKHFNWWKRCFLVTGCLNKCKVKYGFPNTDFDADKLLQCQSNSQQWKVVIEKEGRKCLKKEDR